MAGDAVTPLERVHRGASHTTAYLDCGPLDGPPIIFVHGWPELSISWRHQLRCFGSLGFRAIAPDMRGYGRSTVYEDAAEYTVEKITGDMVDLLDGIGASKAIWVGHDWGGPIVWAMASHHPERCEAVASLCVPYLPEGFARSNLIPLVDRTLYPADAFPSGQWEYWEHYVENPARAAADFERNVETTIAALFRKGDPTGIGQPSVTATIRGGGGWGAFLKTVDGLSFDEDLLTPADFSTYVASCQRNGFSGPDAWYLNDEQNLNYAARAVDGGRITVPALFTNGRYDFTCSVANNRLGDPMRAACKNLRECEIDSGHWMAQEKPMEVNAAITRWLIESVSHCWPFPRG